MAETASLLAIARERLSGITIRDFFNLRMFGFALARAWVYLMFLGTATSSITWNGETVSGIVFLSSTITLSAVLFASALFHKRFEKLSHHRFFRFSGPAMTSLGTLLIATTTIPGAPWVLLGAIGAVFTGAGSGLIDLGYGELYRNDSPGKVRFEAPFAFFIAALIFALTSFVSNEAAVIICSLLPVISGWILFVNLKAFSPTTAAKVAPFEIKLGGFAWKIGICACLIGLADGAVRAVFMTANHTTPESFYRFPMVWASILTMAIIYSCILFSKRTGMRAIYKSVMLVMAVFFMLLPVFTGVSEIESTIALAGYGAFNVMIWMILADISSTYRFSSIMIFGIGWGMVTLGVLLGSTVGQFLASAAPFTPQMLSLIALIATLAVLISYMFIFRESDLITLTKPEANDTSEGNASGSEIKHRFYDRCVSIAEEYKLSPKETEIMILFAKGRSSARIQEELYISRGTCTTHLRHIYQKMDVHDKQEFLDLIEGRDRSG